MRGVPVEARVKSGWWRRRWSDGDELWSGGAGGEVGASCVEGGEGVGALGDGGDGEDCVSGWLRWWVERGVPLSSRRDGAGGCAGGGAGDVDGEGDGEPGVAVVDEVA